MKIIQCEQYSAEWIKERLGLPTASEFHRIITTVKGELSKQADKYAYALVAETLLKRELDKPQVNSWAMQRGRDLEPAAADNYEFLTDDDGAEISAVGLIKSDDGKLGCSPDRLVSLDAMAAGARPIGGLEIKCTLDDNHVGIYFEGPGDDYKQQVQGSLLVADELEWWDLHAYHPDLPARTIRNFRDAPYIEKMRAALSQFLDMRDAMLAKAVASGFFEEAAAAHAAAASVAETGDGREIETLLGLDKVGVILDAAKPGRRISRRKFEPAVSAKLAAAAKQAPKPVETPLAPIAETPPTPPAAGARTPTEKQAAMLKLLTRPAGATRKEMLAANGTKAGATPAIVIRLGELFGYTYAYTGRTADAPTSYRLIRDSGAGGIQPS